MSFSNLAPPKQGGRTRRKSYAGVSSQGMPGVPLYSIPDNDKAIDFQQEQQLIRERLQTRRGSVPARTPVVRTLFFFLFPPC